jgi:putative addiction module component (TIGR02574 family)
VIDPARKRGRFAADWFRYSLADDCDPVFRSDGFPFFPGCRLFHDPAPRYIQFMTAALDITKLSPQERLDLIGELWDSLAAEDVRLTPAQDAELARRMATFEADAKTAKPWDEIEAELDRRAR